MAIPAQSIVVLLAILAATSAHGRDLTLPDPKLTPGVVTMMGKQEICAKKWGKDRRAVTAAMKREVFRRYGLKGNVPTKWCRRDKHGRVFEIDHSCSRENGGADDLLNLWPQCYSGKRNALNKDHLENFLHRQLCADKMTLEQVQWELCLDSADWRDTYQKYLGEPE